MTPKLAGTARARRAAVLHPNELGKGHPLTYTHTHTHTKFTEEKTFSSVLENV